jgi:TonB family protein
MDPNGDLSPPGRDGPSRPSGGVAAGAPMSAPRTSNAAPPALVPSEQQIARAIGNGTQDHLKDIDEGNETALNAKKWKFASFFNRVKQQVRDHWRPAEEYRRRDPSGSIYGQKDRYTLLRVQLKPDGSLANVALETPSGVEFLDDEAIEAFKQAQPFPNPPKQLVEATSGLIDFRFGFFFELSGSPHMKIFKYGNM